MVLKNSLALSNRVKAISAFLLVRQVSTDWKGSSAVDSQELESHKEHSEGYLASEINKRYTYK